MRRHSDPPATASERELEAHAKRDERRERWLFALSMVTLVILLGASAVWVVRNDRTQAAELRAAKAEQRALRAELAAGRAAQDASCQRGEAIRAYVRLDNDLALAFLLNAANASSVPPDVVRTQVAARRAIAASGSFRKGLCP